MADQSTAAQWVSAIGSVIAIASGFLLNHLNQRRSERLLQQERMRARIERLDQVKTAATVMLRRVNALISLLEEKDPNNRADWGGAIGAALDQHRAAVGLINAVDIHDLDATDVARTLFDLRIQVASAVGYAHTQYDFYYSKFVQMDHSANKQIALGSARAVSSSCASVIGEVDKALPSPSHS